MPSALCYEQVAPGEWSEYFCLVNPTCQLSSADEAPSTAKSDLAAAFVIKDRGGSDAELAEFLRARGYVKVDGFQIACD